MAVFYFLIFCTLSQNAKATSTSLKCTQLFALPTVSILVHGFSRNTLVSPDGQWLLSSKIIDEHQQWTLTRINTAQQAQFITELPQAKGTLTPPTKQIVSFETDNLKIYTWIEGHFKSFYQIDYQGTPIGSPGIKKGSSGAVAADSFFTSQKLRFYKHDDHLVAQTEAGRLLGKIPAPETLSRRTIQVQGQHLIVAQNDSLDIYQINDTELTLLKTLSLEQMKQSLAQNADLKKIINKNTWSFGPTFSVADNGLVLLSLQSADQKHNIALVSSPETSTAQVIGKRDLRYKMKTFDVLNSSGDFFTVEQVTKNLLLRREYTTILRFYNQDNEIQHSNELKGYWAHVWNSADTVVIANDDASLLQAWNTTTGQKIHDYKIPRSSSHPLVRTTSVAKLSENAWLVGDSRSDNYYRIFDENLQLQAQVDGILHTTQDVETFGLFATSPLQHKLAPNVYIYTGLAVYNSIGQQVAYFPHLPRLQGVRFVSPNSLLAYDPINQNWMVIRWD